MHNYIWVFIISMFLSIGIGLIDNLVNPLVEPVEIPTFTDQELQIICTEEGL